MNRVLWLALLPLLLALAMAGRLTPQIDAAVRDSEWLVSDASPDFAYGGVAWRLDSAVLHVRAPERTPLPAGRVALAVDMTVTVPDQPIYRLMGCRLSLVDGTGRVWPRVTDPALRRLVLELAPAGDCEGAGYAAGPEAGPLEVSALFVIPPDLPGPLRLRVSTHDGRPWAREVPLDVTPAPGG